MTLAIISKHSKYIQKYVQERMSVAAQELGYDPWGDDKQQAFEQECMDLEEVALKNPDIDWEVKYLEFEDESKGLLVS
tara:strand:- start:262 stop:495 length:234 start_codon:yes stop_codon:yes gene_type:complete